MGEIVTPKARTVEYANLFAIFSRYNMSDIRACCKVPSVSLICGRTSTSGFLTYFGAKAGKLLKTGRRCTTGGLLELERAIEQIMSRTFIVLVFEIRTCPMLSYA